MRLRANSKLLTKAYGIVHNIPRKEFDYGTAPIFQDGRDIPQAKKGCIYFWGVVCGKRGIVPATGYAGYAEAYPTYPV